MKQFYLTLSFFILTCVSGFAQDFETGPFQDQPINTFTSADFNGDGYMDVFGIDFKSNSPDDIFLFLNNSNGGPISFETILLSDTLELRCSPDAADIDGDNDIDVVIALGSTLDLALLLNNGDGTFELMDLGTGGAYTLEFHDLEGDGDLDIVGMYESEDHLDIFVNDGNLNFTKLNIIDAIDDDLVAFAVGDLDNDNDMDLALGYDEFFDKQLFVLENDGNNVFTGGHLESGPTGYTYIRELEIADLDLDGYNDLVAASRYNFACWMNQGNLTFEKKILADYPGTSGFGFLVMELADFTGEGYLDAVLGDNDGPVVWYKNTTSDTVSFEKRTVGGFSSIQAFVTEDFDNDDDTDIVASNGEFRWFENLIEQEPNTAFWVEGLNYEVFPNPFQNEISINGLPDGKYNFKLFNSDGKLVASGFDTGFPIHFSSINPGNYFLQLIDNGGQKQGSVQVIKIE